MCASRVHVSPAVDLTVDLICASVLHQILQLVSFPLKFSSVLCIFETFRQKQISAKDSPGKICTASSQIREILYSYDSLQGVRSEEVRREVVSQIFC